MDAAIAKLAELKIELETKQKVGGRESGMHCQAVDAQPTNQRGSRPPSLGMQLLGSAAQAAAQAGPPPWAKNALWARCGSHAAVGR